MSSDRVPSRSDMMGWNPQQLADYLRRVRPLSVLFVRPRVRPRFQLLGILRAAGLADSCSDGAVNQTER